MRALRSTFLVLLLPTFSFAQAAEEPPAEDGLFLTVPNPIKDTVIDELRKQAERALNQPNRKVKKIVFDFNPEAKDANSTSYGACYTLANYIRELSSQRGITTIAFIHGKTTGHTVLPALACTDLVMSLDAKIGEVVGPKDPVPQVEELAFYAKVVGRDREAVVRKMMDRSVRVVKGMVNQQVMYVDAARIPEGVEVFPKDLNTPLLPVGTIELYGLEQAIRFQLCRRTIETREDLVREYGLSPASLRGDQLQGRSPKASRIDLIGPIDDGFADRLNRQLQTVVKNNETTVFLTFDCRGGKAAAARRCADLLRNLQDDEKRPIRTVAYIPARAEDLSTFLAFACSEIVMVKSQGDESVLGDFEGFLAGAGMMRDPSNTPEYLLENLRQIAQEQGYPTALVEGMLVRNSEVVLARNTANQHQLMLPREMEEANAKAGAGKKEWQVAKVVKQRNTLLKLSAEQAKEWRIAAHVLANRDLKEVYGLYGFEESGVRDAKPGWFDKAAAFLQRPEVSFVLVLVGLMGLILEFKMPGSAIPGLVGLVCFILFFWAQAYVHGQMIYLAVVLFVLGLLLLAAEIFVLPGFGVTGISGIMLILTGIVLATMDKTPSSSEEWVLFAGRLMQYGLSLVGSGIMAMVLARYLPNIPYANRLMLVPPTELTPGEEEFSPLPGMEEAFGLLGQVGTSTSMLRPAGLARFGDILTDVVTEGDFIPAGVAIQVVEVEGTRIVVKQV